MVSCEKILKAAKEQNVDMIGLSGLILGAGMPAVMIGPKHWREVAANIVAPEHFPWPVPKHLLEPWVRKQNLTGFQVDQIDAFGHV